MVFFPHMKFASLLLSAFLALTWVASAQTIPVNGVDNDGFIGVYEINGQNYWWLCVEPEGTPAASLTESFLADAVGFAVGWDQQNTERQNDYIGSAAAQMALPKQIVVMQYVLDTYLPLTTFSTPGAIQDHTNISANYAGNNDFYNSMYAVQQFLAETYGKNTKIDFTDMSGYADRWASLPTPTLAEEARSALYQDILTDIAAKDAADFFGTYSGSVFTASYTALFDEYYLANTLYPLGDINNWQDALIIAIPVPEPSGALLIGCFGLSVLWKRWRKLA